MRSVPQTCPSVTRERKRPSPCRPRARLICGAERSPGWGRLAKAGPRGGSAQLRSAREGTKAPRHLPHLPGGGGPALCHPKVRAEACCPQTRLPPPEALPPWQASLGPKNRHELEHRLRAGHARTGGQLMPAGRALEQRAPGPAARGPRCASGTLYRGHERARGNGRHVAQLSPGAQPTQPALSTPAFPPRAPELQPPCPHSPSQQQ